jgi:hypothetical protein
MWTGTRSTTVGGDHQYLSTTHNTLEHSRTADTAFFTPPHSHSIVPGGLLVTS